MSNRSADWVVAVDIVFPNHANPLGTLFGGRVLELMDINASIACQRFCRHAVVTASTEPVDFRNPIYVGEIIELELKSRGRLDRPDEHDCALRGSRREPPER